MGTAFGKAFGLPPRVDSPAYYDWLIGGILFRLAECPWQRSTRVYFAQSGNDDTGDGGRDNPYKTLAKAQAVHNAFAGAAADVALLFKCGDEWREASGLTILSPNVTVGAWGVGTKPFFNRYTRQLPSASTTWVQDGTQTNCWRTAISYSATLYWARLRGTPDAPLVKASSAANCNATSNSFFIDTGSGGRLWVNVGGSPTTLGLDIEGVETNTASGIVLTADGCRVQGIRFSGWGVNGGQNFCILTAVTGHNACVVIDCEADDSRDHIVGHLSTGYTAGDGGIASFLRIRFGGSHVAGATYSVHYSATGAGQEGMFIDCQCKRGWMQTNGTTAPFTDRAFYSHTGGAAPDLMLRWGCRTVRPSSALPAGSPGYWGDAANDGGFSTVADLKDVRGFILRDYADTDSGWTQRFASPGVAVADSNWRFNVPTYAVQPQLGGADATGWFINSTIECTLTGAMAYEFSLTFTGANYNPKIWNSRIHVNGGGFAPAGIGINRLNLPSVGATGTWGTGDIRNSVFAVLKAGSDTAYLAHNNAAAAIHNLAVFGLTSSTGDSGYSNGLSVLALAYDPTTPEPIGRSDLPAIGPRPNVAGEAAWATMQAILDRECLDVPVIADPWETVLPGSYSGQQAGNVVSRLLVGSVTMTAPVDYSDDDRLNLVQGDDYTDDDDLIPQWRISDWSGPDLTDCSLTLRLLKLDSFGRTGVNAQADLEVAAAAAADGDDFVITAPISAAETVLLYSAPPARATTTHRYQLLATTASGKDHTVVLGPATVVRRIDPQD